MYRRDVEKGRLSQEKADKILSNYSTSTHLKDLSDKDMIIEAVFEELEVKKVSFHNLMISQKKEPCWHQIPHI